jgi:hypothetical protein
MHVLIGSEKATLSDALIAGVGGEATVYRSGDRAVKIFHDPSQVDAKMEKVSAFPALPPEVIAPTAIVRDAKSKRPIGYAMPFVPKAHPLGELMKRSFREGVVPASEVVRLFAEIHRVTRALHASRVIVGDLNDGNLLFSKTRPYFIDVDSMQVGGHPCTVAHERYLDPALYGRDLSKGPAFTAATDWYAYDVLLFSALLYLHPYGGVHPALPTMLRRAEARSSVFDPKVKYPKGAVHYRVLSDALCQHFVEVFERGRRGAFPEALLEERWTVCRCGLEHARPVCPGCASMNPSVIVSEAVRGSVRAIRIFQTEGRILAAAMQPSLTYVYEEGGAVRREDGSKVMEERPAAGMRFVPAGATTWIGYEGQLVAVERERIAGRATTATFGGTSSFDAMPGRLFDVEDGWLVMRGGEGPARIGKVIDGQTFVRAGHGLGFGFYRVGRTAIAFVFQPGRPGFSDVDLGPIDGRLVDVDAVFDAKHAAVSLLLERDGKRYGALYLIEAGGRVVGRRIGPADGDRILSSARGRCVVGGRIVAATEEGLVALDVDPATRTIVERTVFSDTEPFVSGGADLLPGPDGSIYVVTTKEIMQLVMS